MTQFSSDEFLFIHFECMRLCVSVSKIDCKWIFIECCECVYVMESQFTELNKRHIHEITFNRCAKSHAINENYNKQQQRRARATIIHKTMKSMWIGNVKKSSSIQGYA